MNQSPPAPVPEQSLKEQQQEAKAADRAMNDLIQRAKEKGAFVSEERPHYSQTKFLL